MPNLANGITEHARLRAELIARWPELAHGENLDVLDDTLEGISSLPDMIGQVLRSALEDERVAKSLGEHIDKLRMRQKRLHDRAVRKRNLALDYCIEGQIRRVPQPDFHASVTMSRGHVIITDEQALGDQWVKITRTPDKKKIGDALRSGADIDGAELSNPAPHLTISTI